MTSIEITSYPVLLLSDVHLGKTKTNTKDQDLLIRFLEFQLSEGFTPIFLGDIFDYWMEYGSWYPPVFEPIIDFFTSYHRQFSSIRYITGNHDNWTHTVLKDVGFEIESEALSVQWGEKRLLLHHGDGFFGVQPALQRSLLNRILRNQTFLKTYQTVTSPDFGVNLMHWFSDFSRKRNSQLHLNDTLLNEWSRLFLR